jgi:hypothetical protein
MKTAEHVEIDSTKGVGITCYNWLVVAKKMSYSITCRKKFQPPVSIQFRPSFRGRILQSLGLTGLTLEPEIRTLNGNRTHVIKLVEMEARLFPHCRHS